MDLSRGRAQSLGSGAAIHKIGARLVQPEAALPHDAHKGLKVLGVVAVQPLPVAAEGHRAEGRLVVLAERAVAHQVVYRGRRPQRLPVSDAREAVVRQEAEPQAAALQQAAPDTCGTVVA